jgi:hypothetical protein
MNVALKWDLQIIYMVFVAAWLSADTLSVKCLPGLAAIRHLHYIAEARFRNLGANGDVSGIRGRIVNSHLMPG